MNAQVQNSVPSSPKIENNGDIKSQKDPAPLVIGHGSALRNYAAKDCGAKVLFSNEEAENRVCFYSLVLKFPVGVTFSCVRKLVDLLNFFCSILLIYLD